MLQGSLLMPWLTCRVVFGVLLSLLTILCRLVVGGLAQPHRPSGSAFTLVLKQRVLNFRFSLSRRVFSFSEDHSSCALAYDATDSSTECRVACALALAAPSCFRVCCAITV